jgi:hypothetical protein
VIRARAVRTKNNVTNLDALRHCPKETASQASPYICLVRVILLKDISKLRVEITPILCQLISEILIYFKVCPDKAFGKTSFSMNRLSAKHYAVVAFHFYGLKVKLVLVSEKIVNQNLGTNIKPM